MMFRPHYQIHTFAGGGTQFEKKDVLDPLKKFLAHHNISPEIVTDVSFYGNSISIELKKGCAKEHGKEMNSAFGVLSTSKYSYSLSEVDDKITCWVPFLEDIVEANNKHLFELYNQNRPGKF
jgi:hypothetical protein